MVVTLPQLLILLFAFTGFASLIAGGVALFRIRRSVKLVERTLVPPVQGARIAILADRHDPRTMEIYETVRRWVVVEPSDRASRSHIVDL